MKTQSRLGITIPEQDASCCCAAQIAVIDSEPEFTINLIQFSGCDGFNIEWQSTSFIEEDWVTVQSGGETYEYSDELQFLRVILTKDGCCTKVTDVYYTG